MNQSIAQKKSAGNMNYFTIAAGCEHAEKHLIHK